MTSNGRQVKITINGLELLVDESLTILEAARLNKIDILTLCHHPKLSNWGGCRLCVVQVDQSPKLVASCVTPVRSGMEVMTDNAATIASRRMTLELLFAERNHNCMFCPQSGACDLQKAAYALQMDHLTVSPSFAPFPVDVTGEYMAIDHNRCILCGRCVRACQEIAGCSVLGFHNRGPQTLIGFDLLETRADSSCLNCGACLQVCPTGAISSRYRAHYAVMGQPTDQYTVSSVCAGCALLCPTCSVIRDNQLIGVEGILGPSDLRPDRGQLCAKGRFEVLKTQGRRLLSPMIKDASGQFQEHSWDQAYEAVSRGFADLKAHQGGGALFGMTSSSLSNETLVLFGDLMHQGWETGFVDTLDGDHFRLLSNTFDPQSTSLPVESSWKQIAFADFVLVVGVESFQNHPLLLSLLRQAIMEKGSSVAILGRNRCAPLLTTHYLAVEADELPVLTSALARRVGAQSQAQTMAARLDADRMAVLEKIARSYADAQSPWIVVGDQLTGAQQQATLASVLAIARVKADLSTANGLLTLLKPATNSAAAWRLGLVARQPFKTQGKAGLLVLGDEQDQALGALDQCGFLVALTPYVSPLLADKAQVLLPTALWMEEDGSYAGLDGQEIVFKPRVVQPPAGVRSSWEILMGLGGLSGRPTPPASWAEVHHRGIGAI